MNDSDENGWELCSLSDSDSKELTLEDVTELEWDESSDSCKEGGNERCNKDDEIVVSSGDSLDNNHSDGERSVNNINNASGVYRTVDEDIFGKSINESSTFESKNYEDEESDENVNLGSKNNIESVDVEDKQNRDIYKELQIKKSTKEEERDSSNFYSKINEKDEFVNKENMIAYDDKISSSNLYCNNDEEEVRNNNAVEDNFKNSNKEEVLIKSNSEKFFGEPKEMCLLESAHSKKVADKNENIILCDEKKNINRSSSTDMHGMAQIQEEISDDIGNAMEFSDIESSSDPSEGDNIKGITNIDVLCNNCNEDIIDDPRNIGTVEDDLNDSNDIEDKNIIDSRNNITIKLESKHEEKLIDDKAADFECNEDNKNLLHNNETLTGINTLYEINKDVVFENIHSAAVIEESCINVKDSFSMDDLQEELLQAFSIDPNETLNSADGAPNKEACDIASESTRVNDAISFEHCANSSVSKNDGYINEELNDVNEDENVNIYLKQIPEDVPCEEKVVVINSIELMPEKNDIMHKEKTFRTDPLNDKIEVHEHKHSIEQLVSNSNETSDYTSDEREFLHENIKMEHSSIENKNDITTNHTDVDENINKDEIVKREQNSSAEERIKLDWKVKDDTRLDAKEIVLPVTLDLKKDDIDIMITDKLNTTNEDVLDFDSVSSIDVNKPNFVGDLEKENIIQNSADSVKNTLDLQINSSEVPDSNDFNNYNDNKLKMISGLNDICNNSLNKDTIINELNEIDTEMNNKDNLKDDSNSSKLDVRKDLTIKNRKKSSETINNKNILEESNSLNQTYQEISENLTIEENRDVWSDEEKIFQVNSAQIEEDFIKNNSQENCVNTSSSLSEITYSISENTIIESKEKIQEKAIENENKKVSNGIENEELITNIVNDEISNNIGSDKIFGDNFISKKLEQSSVDSNNNEFSIYNMERNLQEIQNSNLINDFDNEQLNSLFSNSEDFFFDHVGLIAKDESSNYTFDENKENINNIISDLEDLNLENKNKIEDSTNIQINKLNTNTHIFNNEENIIQNTSDAFNLAEINDMFESCSEVDEVFGFTPTKSVTANKKFTNEFKNIADNRNENLCTNTSVNKFTSNDNYNADSMKEDINSLYQNSSSLINYHSTDFSIKNSVFKNNENLQIENSGNAPLISSQSSHQLNLSKQFDNIHIQDQIQNNKFDNLNSQIQPETNKIDNSHIQSPIEIKKNIPSSLNILQKPNLYDSTNSQPNITAPFHSNNSPYTTYQNYNNKINISNTYAFQNTPIIGAKKQKFDFLPQPSYKKESNQKIQLDLTPNINEETTQQPHKKILFKKSLFVCLKNKVIYCDEIRQKRFNKATNAESIFINITFKFLVNPLKIYEKMKLSINNKYKDRINELKSMVKSNYSEVDMAFQRKIKISGKKSRNISFMNTKDSKSNIKNQNINLSTEDVDLVNLFLNDPEEGIKSSLKSGNWLLSLLFSHYNNEYVNTKNNNVSEGLNLKFSSNNNPPAHNQIEKKYSFKRKPSVTPNVIDSFLDSFFADEEISFLLIQLKKFDSSIYNLHDINNFYREYFLLSIKNDPLMGEKIIRKISSYSLINAFTCFVYSIHLGTFSQQQVDRLLGLFTLPVFYDLLLSLNSVYGLSGIDKTHYVYLSLLNDISKSKAMEKFKNVRQSLRKEYVTYFDKLFAQEKRWMKGLRSVVDKGISAIIGMDISDKKVENTGSAVSSNSNTSTQSNFEVLNDGKQSCTLENPKITEIDKHNFSVMCNKNLNMYDGEKNTDNVSKDVLRSGSNINFDSLNNSNTNDKQIVQNTHYNDFNIIRNKQSTQHEDAIRMKNANTFNIFPPTRSTENLLNQQSHSSDQNSNLQTKNITQSSLKSKAESAISNEENEGHQDVNVYGFFQNYNKEHTKSKNKIIDENLKKVPFINKNYNTNNQKIEQNASSQQILSNKIFSDSSSNLEIPNLNSKINQTNENLDKKSSQHKVLSYGELVSPKRVISEENHNLYYSENTIDSNLSAITENKILNTHNNSRDIPNIINPSIYQNILSPNTFSSKQENNSSSNISPQKESQEQEETKKNEDDKFYQQKHYSHSFADFFNAETDTQQNIVSTPNTLLSSLLKDEEDDNLTTKSKDKQKKDDKKNDSADQSTTSIFNLFGIFSKKKTYKVDLSEAEADFVFDEKSKKWINKKETAEKSYKKQTYTAKQEVLPDIKPKNMSCIDLTNITNANTNSSSISSRYAGVKKIKNDASIFTGTQKNQPEK
ncbi:hypothetical protein EDEG_00810 [Edhazardia aedis USNM 41457]|uniref:Uncharacterized protein n=1 Tax=Edhazardia aedis (strain USNM 41457) TaxID=1003232 RepID=J9DV02_EDHAE|nr:hypothetical protein EDEG_00810 [Edhazardia aedis USNM 41457]|eukprot:EJW05097.1 hypothetical protein EDEG_00810 [Edhazardia aedis USNM 41457]